MFTQDNNDDDRETNKANDSDNWTGLNNLSRHNVCLESYAKRFDTLTRKYGRYLMHQSNRDLPRTHFYTNYTSIGYKNASELSGMIIVFLMVFSTKEGEEKLDENLGEERTSDYIHLFELMLMLENFCKTESHKRKDVFTFQKLIPSILAYYKKTVNRQDGNQMKIIKFHLPLHFADDIFRFGCMANFDSSIGESHHKVFAKKPSKNTQRRKEIFEAQTAKRQIDNLAIDRAYDSLYSSERYTIKHSSEQSLKNKNKIIEFCSHINNLVYVNDIKTNRPLCAWKDHVFLKQLFNECCVAIKSGNLHAPIKFFTQHNRGGIIFRADPQFHKKQKEPWYDWCQVDWGDKECNKVPSKLLIFMEVSASDFKCPFKFGDSFIENPGSYAISYSFDQNNNIPAHLESMLVTYGELLTNEDDTPKCMLLM